MKLNNFINEFSFNQTWLFLQSRYYGLSFQDMQSLVSSGLNDGNDSDKNPLDGDVFDPAMIYFEQNLNSDRVKNCWRIKIQISIKQYEKLVNTHPYNEF